MSKEFLYKDLTYNIRKCIFDVQNEVGVGFDEKTYHQALIRKFKKEGLGFVSKERKKLEHRNILIREFELDFLVENMVILSLKCLPCDFLQINYVQLFTELKLWQKHVGLIANFGLQKVKIARRIYYEKTLEVEENYEYVKNKINEKQRDTMKKLRQSILFVGNSHGLGFGKSVVQKLIETELIYQKIHFEKEVPIIINYLGESIRTYKMRHLLINKEIILAITALQDTITQCDISTVKSYLHALKLKIGLVVNFGKSKLEIRGVRGDIS